MSLPRTLQFRLFGSFALVLLATTLAVWSATVWLFSNVLEQEREAQLEDMARVLVERGLPFTPDLLSQLKRLIHADIILIEDAGNIGLSTLAPAEAGLAEAVQAGFRTWLDNGGAAANGGADLAVGGRAFKLVLQRPAAERDSRYVALAMLSPLDEVGRAVRQATWMVGGLSLLSMLVLAGLGHRIALGITRPLAGLARMAREITAGRRRVHVPVDRRDEIGALAMALNAMASEIASFEEQLARNARLAALGQLAARLAHEIRNPLTAIKMQIQLLEENLAAEDLPIAETVLAEIRRLELVVSNTLDLGRQISLDIRAVDLNGVIAEVLSLLIPQLKHRGIVLEAELASGLPEIAADANRIKQLLLNLLLNAADVLSEGGRIGVRTRLAPDGRVILAVEDSGPGIDPDKAEQLFAPLYTEKSEGFGLGLAISREIARLHGGDIEVSSGGLGGARFSVSLPLEPPA
jgi:signal transduction histidine kinase